MLPITADVSFVTDVLSVLSSVWTWVSSNTALAPMIGIAVAGVGVSMIVGIFFRSRG